MSTTGVDQDVRTRKLTAFVRDNGTAPGQRHDLAAQGACDAEVRDLAGRVFAQLSPLCSRVPAPSTACD